MTAVINGPDRSMSIERERGRTRARARDDGQTRPHLPSALLFFLFPICCLVGFPNPMPPFPRSLPTPRYASPPPWNNRGRTVAGVNCEERVSKIGEKEKEKRDIVPLVGVDFCLLPNAPHVPPGSNGGGTHYRSSRDIKTSVERRRVASRRRTSKRKREKKNY